MSNTPFMHFISLVSLDQNIQSLISKKTACDTAASFINKQKDDSINTVELAQQKAIQFKKNVDTQELEMQDLDAKEQEKKRLLETLSDYKECQAIKHEIDAINRFQVAQEQKVIDAWASLEVAQQALEKKRAEGENIVKAFDEQLATIAHDKQGLIEQLAGLESQRTEKKLTIPAEWLEKYDIMAMSVSNPVVPIEQASCTGCYQQLTIQDIVRAKNGALLQCKKCYRLLYLADSIA